MADDPSHRITRSISVGQPLSFSRFPNKQNKAIIETPKTQVCHLISVGLWEAISGEKATPTKICQIQELYLPQTGVNGATTTQHSQQNMLYVKMAKDRHECMQLQEQMPKASPKELENIFNALYPHFNELVSDGAANFVIQKLCDYLTVEQQNLVLEFFLEDIQKVVEQPNGCRVLQKFIETTSPENIDKIFLALLPNFVSLCSSQNGNHIAQRFIIFIPDRIPEIIKAITPYTIKLVVDNWGCRVIQQLFDKLDINELTPLVNQVLSCADKLATNQFGNYVVQNILTSKKPEYMEALIQSFKGHFFEFSMHKFASNVIEKCIRNADKRQQQEIFNEIIGCEGAYDEPKILEMVSDQFGNYVIQRIIEYGNYSQQNIIAEVVDQNYDKLIKCSYSKHVISCLENIDLL